MLLWTISNFLDSKSWKEMTSKRLSKW